MVRADLSILHGSARQNHNHKRHQQKGLTFSRSMDQLPPANSSSEDEQQELPFLTAPLITPIALWAIVTHLFASINCPVAPRLRQW